MNKQLMLARMAAMAAMQSALAESAVDSAPSAATKPAEGDDFPLGQACDLSGESACESCQ